MKKEKKVSIIVPVYNVEDYLQKCIDSIRFQTYKNVEIILVDDGSTDKSGSICDAYLENDNRIVVIHKANGGLSDARNAGLDISTGDYIGFVDSDDSLKSDFIEVMVSLLEKHNSDVVCCRYTNTWINGKTEEIGKDDTEVILQGDEALKEYLHAKRMDPFVCNKLFKSSVIGNKVYSDKKIRFIKGIVGEDNPFCIEVFKKTGTVVMIGYCGYYYLQDRNGAITNQQVTKKKIDSVYYWDTVRVDCEKNYPHLYKYALRRQVLFYIGLYNKIFKNQTYKNDVLNIRTFLKCHLKEITSSEICEFTVKVSAILLSQCVPLYNTAMKIYKKTVGSAKL